MRLVFLGAPGVGKGTQAKRLSKTFGVPHIATGDILRAAILKSTAAGQEAKAYMDAGQLVPDALVIRVVAEQFSESGLRSGFILDGFPRTLEQAEALAAMKEAMPLDGVLYFALQEEELVLRISGRRSCPKCQEIYHISGHPPEQEGICDRCRVPLTQRRDDHPEVVGTRLRAYKKETAPLIEYYEKQGRLHTIDASGTVDAVERLVGDVVHRLCGESRVGS